MEIKERGQRRIAKVQNWVKFYEEGETGPIRIEMKVGLGLGPKT